MGQLIILGTSTFQAHSGRPQADFSHGNGHICIQDFSLRDIPDLTGKVIIVTGGKYVASVSLLRDSY